MDSFLNTKDDNMSLGFGMKYAEKSVFFFISLRFFINFIFIVINKLSIPIYIAAYIANLFFVFLF
jgi:hypothetical protein